MFANWDLSLGGAGQSIIIRLNLVGGGTEDVAVVLGAGIGGFGGPFNFGFTSTNPFESVTTVTVKIVSQLTGDLEFNSPQTLVAFALGLTLFVVTLGLNVYALHIVRKYREQYD